MRIFILYVSSCLLLTNCYSTQIADKSDLEEYNLKGKVKSVRTLAYETEERLGQIEKGNKTDKASYYDPEQIDYFNIYGILIEETDYNLNGTINRNSKRINDTKSETLLYNDEGKITRKIISKFDKFGNEIEISFYDGEDLVYDGKRTYKYNNDGNVIERISINEEGRAYQSSRSVYDENGNLKEHNYFNYIEYQGKSETRSHKELYKYDGNGNLIEKTYFSGGKKTSTSQIKYSKNGNIKEWHAKYTHDNSTGLYIEEYDENNNLIYECQYQDGVKQRDLEFSHEYVYDRQGNWIKRIDYVFGEPKYLIERIIEYHN